MSYPKRPLQDAEETLGFAVQLIEVDRLRHEGVSAGLQVARGVVRGVTRLIEGEPRALLRTLEVSAYRVIQEALTNAFKHSGGATARVRLSYKPTVLEVDISDDGDGQVAQPAEHVGGHGLIGMRERVGLHGGHLRARQTPEGFAVHATFPLNGTVK